MKRSLKLVGLVSLSVLLAHAGVAWILENCLMDNKDENRAGAAYSEPSPAGFSALLGDMRQHAATKLHCFAHDETGPMAQAPTESRLQQREEGGSTAVFPIRGLIDGQETNSLWLTFFERYEPFSFRSGTSRHLVLSVFRI